VMNSLAVLEEGGTIGEPCIFNYDSQILIYGVCCCIVLHDLNPRREYIQTREDNNNTWNGDCWRAAVALRVINELEIVVVDIDHGVGVIRKRPNTHRLPSEWETSIGGWVGHHA
jgi:hypothetical protein